MAVIKNKAKVGDYVKVIKKLPYKDQMDVDIGDIGVVNYVASTGKYSVHIDGKKNPKDKDAKSRAYGKLYDFWIPFECCEVIDNEELTKKCLFENADALDTYTYIGTIDNTVCLSTISNDVSTWSGVIYKSDCSTSLYDYSKEREEKKMKEIKNQKVVDLYFKRKEEVLKNEFEAAKDAIVKADSNYAFIKQLKDQFDEYIEKNEIKDVIKNAFPELPLTEESETKCNEAYNDCTKRIDELNHFKEEILAMLSGCETYEQEMEILRGYYIVTDDNRLV
jgi:hypothetical protein